MTLNDRVTADMKAAMKAGDKLRLETLRTLRAQLIELTKRGSDQPVSADDEIAVVRSAIKKRKEAIDLYQQAGRKELVHQEQQELEILRGYLPEQLSKEQVQSVVEETIRETGAASPKDFGKVMGLVMKKLKGQAEGKMIQDVVRQQLRVES